MIDGRGIEGNLPLNGISDRRSEDFSVGYVPVPIALHGLYPSDGKGEIRSRTPDVNLGRFIHQHLQCLHILGHALIIQGTHIEIEILEGRGTHSHLLGHGGGGITQDHPFGVFNPGINMNRLPPMFLVQGHPVLGDIGKLGDVIPVANEISV